jgi:uncharacterized protein YjeT (DUF2065 family)
MLAPYLIGAVLVIMGLLLLLWDRLLRLVGLSFILVGAFIIWRYHTWLFGG